MVQSDGRWSCDGGWSCHGGWSGDGPVMVWSSDVELCVIVCGGAARGVLVY